MNTNITRLDKWTWNDIYALLKNGMPVDQIVFELAPMEVKEAEVLFVIKKLREGGHDF